MKLSITLSNAIISERQDGSVGLIMAPLSKKEPFYFHLLKRGIISTEKNVENGTSLELKQYLFNTVGPFSSNGAR